MTATNKTFYRHLKKQGFPREPDGFKIEVQCWNCNLGAAVNGGVCPHKEKGRVGTAVRLPTDAK